MIIKLNSPSISLPAGLPSLLTEPGSVLALQVALWTLVTDPNSSRSSPRVSRTLTHMIGKSRRTVFRDLKRLDVLGCIRRARTGDTTPGAITLLVPGPIQTIHAPGPGATHNATAQTGHDSQGIRQPPDQPPAGDAESLHDLIARVYRPIADTSDLMALARGDQDALKQALRSLGHLSPRATYTSLHYAVAAQLAKHRMEKSVAENFPPRCSCLRPPSIGSRPR